MPELLSSPLLLAITALAGYLLGSIPFGIVISKAMGLGDLRQIGSGNIGATNVLRTGNKGAAAATLILDGGKGALAVLIARAVAGEDAAQLAGFCAFLGHLYPVWLRFKGGKGVATYLGTLLALAPALGITACILWLATAFVFRYSSLAALSAAALTPLAAWGFGIGIAPSVTLLAAALGALIWMRHQANITRLREGTEPRIGRKEPKK